MKNLSSDYYDSYDYYQAWFYVYLYTPLEKLAAYLL